MINQARKVSLLTVILFGLAVVMFAIQRVSATASTEGYRPAPLTGTTQREIENYVRQWVSAVVQEPEAPIVLLETSVGLDRLNDLGFEIGSYKQQTDFYTTAYYTVVIFSGGDDGFRDLSGVAPGWGMLHSEEYHYLGVVFHEGKGLVMHATAYQADQLPRAMSEAMGK